MVDDPAGPVRWGVNVPGDAGRRPVLDPETVATLDDVWHRAARSSVDWARLLGTYGLHKQIANRLLEPFVWTTALVSATDYANFFRLRVNTAAQPEFQRLAHLMLKAYVIGTPVARDWGQWHAPFSDQQADRLNLHDRLCVSVARAARVSYTAHDGEHPLASDLTLYRRLADAGHWSPFEHQAVARQGRHANFTGWSQLRESMDRSADERVDFAGLLATYEREIGRSGGAWRRPWPPGRWGPC